MGDRMKTLRRFLSRIDAFFRRGPAEREMSREIAAHQALANADGTDRALRIPEEQTREMHRDARSFVWLEQLVQDIRHAARGLWKSPRFSGVALFSLALGIGVNTAIFTLVNGILLKRLDLPAPQTILPFNPHLHTLYSVAFSSPPF